LKKTNGRENNEILFFEDLLIEISNYYLSCSQDPNDKEEEEEKRDIKSKNDQKNEKNSSSSSIMMKGWKGLLYLDLKVFYFDFFGMVKVY